MSILQCQYDARSGAAGCPNERTMDFEFCIPHLQTPRGRQHILDVVARGNLTLPSEVKAAIDHAREIPEEDYQTTALEKMAEVLDTLVAWRDEARRNLDSLGGHENWRYKDRAGTEQARTELGVYERAMDRLTRHLSGMGKVALNEKLVTLGKAQVDMMIRLMVSVLMDLKLSNDEKDRARALLLEKLRNEANLVPRVERHAQQQLAIAGDHRAAEIVEGQSAYVSGGITGVRIRGEKVS